MLLVSQGGGEGATLQTNATGVTSVVESDVVATEPKRILEVVAASPLPSGFHPGSGYGYRASPRTGARTFHAGADFLAPRGTPVYAARWGIVEAVSENRRGTRVQFAGYGNAVVLYHPELDQWSFYAHLSEANVEVGQKVVAGELLGAVGNTTNGRFARMGSHLHFEVRERAPDGTSPFPGPYRSYNIDPEAWLAALGVVYEAPSVNVESAPLLVVRERTRETLAL